MNYDFKQKEHWRNRMWNIIMDRVPCHPRDAIVLYLPAEQDLDREAARKRGFHDQNLIAVDINLDVVRAIRARGLPAIHGDVFEVIRNWRSDHRPDAIFLDLLHGVDANVVGLAQYEPLLSTDAVVAINLMRGRDKAASIYKVVLEKNGEKYNKHRGQQAFEYITGMLTVHAFSYMGKKGPDAVRDAIRSNSGMIEWNSHCCKWERLMKSSNPVFESYKSSCGIYFDSALYNTRMGGMHEMVYSKIRQCLTDKDREVARQIAAVLAHRTMRLSA